jgi:hypothetical protein
LLNPFVCHLQCRSVNNLTDFEYKQVVSG